MPSSRMLKRSEAVEKIPRAGVCPGRKQGANDPGSRMASVDGSPVDVQRVAVTDPKGNMQRSDTKILFHLLVPGGKRLT